MSYLDLLKEFHSRAIAEVYPPSARVLYEGLLYDFNAAYWKPELIYSERELSKLTGLSPATVHRAIKFLSDRGIIKTWRTRNKTVVKLLSQAVPQPQSRSDDEANVKQSRSKSEAKSLVSYTPHAKTEDLKDRDSRADAHVCEGDVAGATKPQVSNTRTLPLSSPTSSDVDANRIHEEWVKEIGQSLRKDQLAELAKLASEDYTRAQVAIARTKAQKLSKEKRQEKLSDAFAYFKAVYFKLTADEVAKQAPTKAIPPKYTDTTEQELMFGMRKEEDD